MKYLLMMGFFLISTSAFTEDKMVESKKLIGNKPNTWIDAKLNYALPTKYGKGSSNYWSTTDGYCDSLYRSKTGSILIRTGIRSKKLGLNPGYYSNTWLEWNLSTDSIEVIDVFNWGGGSGGGGKLFDGFKEKPTPSPRHTYDCLAYVPETDSAYLIHGANWKICLNKKKTNPEAIAQLKKDGQGTWKFNFKERKWTWIKGNLWDFKKTSPYEGHMEYWAKGKKLIYLDAAGRNYCEFDIVNEKWELIKLSNKIKFKFYTARSTWDSKRNLWVFRLGANVCTFNPKERKFTLLPNCWDLPPSPNREEMKKMKKNKQKPNVKYSWKSISYNPKHDVYMITGPTGDDTRVYNIKAKTWSTIKGGEIKLPNGYLEYDAKSDLFGLVIQHKAFKFQYIPK